MGSVVRSLRLHGGLPVGTALTLQNAFKEILNVKMADNPDVGGGGTTGSVEFQITDFAGDNIDGEKILELAVFDDIGLATPAANATLDTAANGTILGGAGTAALKVQTDATGKFKCTLTDLIDETVYLGCSPSFGSPLIDCREIDSVTFSA